MAEMTREVIVASCKANGGYEAPLLNDQLYLHCKGFMKIANLEPYTSAKVLWLEQNALEELSGLSQQQELVSLFVQNNTIRSLRTLATPLRNLRVINISHNYITSLAGLAAGCPMLETLQASHNRIASLQACEDLWQLSTTLTSVDLSFNAIEQYEEKVGELDDGNGTATEEAPPAEQLVADGNCGAEGSENASTPAVLGVTPSTAMMRPKQPPLVVVDFFRRLPEVSVIYLHGNSIIHGLRHYRRNMILHLPALTYLDERPVFPEERRLVEAWGTGGEEAEAATRSAIRAEKKEHLNSCVRVLVERMEDNRAVRDRLTEQWQLRQAEELARVTERRRSDRDSRARVEAVEQSERGELERDEQNTWWDLEEAFQGEHEALCATEAVHRHAYEQAVAVAQVTEEARRELEAEEEAEAEVEVKPPADDDGAVGAALPSDSRKASTSDAKSATLAELAKSDEDVLQEIEEDIQRVLQSVAFASQQQESRRSIAEADFDRATSKAERAAHAAVDKVASRLRAERARDWAASREERWQRFEQWEKRVRHVDPGM